MRATKSKKIRTYAFIDASNLFYGGEKSLGWKIDYQKLLKYLKIKYGTNKVFYYAGVELYGFKYSILQKEPIDLDALLMFYRRKKIVKKYIQRVKFYRKLRQFGYRLRLKPTKIFWNNGRRTKKANCDVDLTFDMMRYIAEYSDAVLLSGDGDFAILVKYLKEIGKSVTILARSERTAKELRILAGKDFRDFHYLREILKFRYLQ
ncbi:MAG: NYN domain-containing protein [Patescibacteria group bacterium]